MDSKYGTNTGWMGEFVDIDDYEIGETLPNPDTFNFLDFLENDMDFLAGFQICAKTKSSFHEN